MKLLLIAHGGFARGAKEALTMIAGELDHVDTLSLEVGEDPAYFGQRLESYFQSHDVSQYLVFVDFYGGTPGNEIFKILKKYNIHAITGFNMPMLLDAAIFTMHCDEIITDVSPFLEAAHEGIMDLNSKYKEIFGE